MILNVVYIISLMMEAHSVHQDQRTPRNLCLRAHFFSILVSTLRERFYICIALQAKHEKTITLGPFV